MPATFTVGPGGVLDPPQIAVPKNVDIDLTVVSKDSRPDRFGVKTPRGYAVTVPAGARTVVILTRVPSGSYTVEVDHQVRGHLIVGVAPGP